ncbi:hypothetical protein L1887_60207 [Cichorium endivia]|nr:hypothetical protein L1887_60207 [Cichorium endivia]
MSGSPWPRAIVGGLATIAVGYAIMKATTPTDQQFYDALSPDLKRQVDAQRQATQRKAAYAEQLKVSIWSCCLASKFPPTLTPLSWPSIGCRERRSRTTRRPCGQQARQHATRRRRLAGSRCTPSTRPCAVGSRSLCSVESEPCSDLECRPLFLVRVCNLDRRIVRSSRPAKRKLLRLKANISGLFRRRACAGRNAESRLTAAGPSCTTLDARGTQGGGGDYPKMSPRRSC